MGAIADSKENRADMLAPAVPVDALPTDRPIVTLDVDGVLNAYDFGREPSPYQPKVEDDPEPYGIDRGETITLPYQPTGAYGHVSKREYLIQWATGLADDVARAADEGVATFVWLTSWQDEAGLLASEMLWPGRPSPVIGYVDAKAGATRCTYASKRVAMRAICDAMESARPDDPMPVISFDDDMPWDAGMWGGGVEFPGFFHGVATDPRHGITRSQWRHAMGIAREATGCGTVAGGTAEEPSEDDPSE